MFGDMTLAGIMEDGSNLGDVRVSAEDLVLDGEGSSVVGIVEGEVVASFDSTGVTLESI
jgi:hypothetical protein